MTPTALCGLLAESDRLQVFAAVVLGASTPSAVESATGLPARVVEPAIRRLQQGGLLTVADGALAASAGTFKEAVRASATPAGPQPQLDPDRQRDLILRTFITDGRLAQIPAAQAKRLVVLEHIVSSFEPGVRYPEREIDAILRAWHDDHAALRRYLVDAGLLSRDSNVYWRSGGPVVV
ncbi:MULTISPECIES: DUF2087 domain-containing protein [Dactylosporangium]|uniref:DUF2087 domain-containing protein n=1 Tax=Dactylosporangium vinaceum TaxID=53362 RepID=A0ABV5M648_9ACTN|nr:MULTISPECIES: DUF2087 domain-containing protein [Dactylosporangium]